MSPKVNKSIGIIFLVNLRRPTLSSCLFPYTEYFVRDIHNYYIMFVKLTLDMSRFIKFRMYINKSIDTIFLINLRRPTLISC